MNFFAIKLSFKPLSCSVFFFKIDAVVLLINNRLNNGTNYSLGEVAKATVSRRLSFDWQSIHLVKWLFCSNPVYNCCSFLMCLNPKERSLKMWQNLKLAWQVKTCWNTVKMSAGRERNCLEQSREPTVFLKRTCSTTSWWCLLAYKGPRPSRYLSILFSYGAVWSYKRRTALVR